MSPYLPWTKVFLSKNTHYAICHKFANKIIYFEGLFWLRISFYCKTVYLRGQFTHTIHTSNFFKVRNNKSVVKANDSFKGSKLRSLLPLLVKNWQGRNLYNLCENCKMSKILLSNFLHVKIRNFIYCLWLHNLLLNNLKATSVRRIAFCRMSYFWGTEKGITERIKTVRWN